MCPRSRERSPIGREGPPSLPSVEKRRGGNPRDREGKGKDRERKRNGERSTPLRSARWGRLPPDRGPLPRRLRRDKGGLTAREPRGTFDRTEDGSSKIFRVNAPRQPRAWIQILGNTWYEGQDSTPAHVPRICTRDKGRRWAHGGPTRDNDDLRGTSDRLTARRPSTGLCDVLGNDREKMPVIVPTGEGLETIGFFRTPTGTASVRTKRSDPGRLDNHS